MPVRQLDFPLVAGVALNATLELGSGTPFVPDVPVEFTLDPLVLLPLLVFALSGTKTILRIPFRVPNRSSGKRFGDIYYVRPPAIIF